MDLDLHHIVSACQIFERDISNSPRNSKDHRSVSYQDGLTSQTSSRSRWTICVSNMFVQLYLLWTHLLFSCRYTHLTDWQQLKLLLCWETLLAAMLTLAVWASANWSVLTFLKCRRDFFYHCIIQWVVQLSTQQAAWCLEANCWPL